MSSVSESTAYHEAGHVLFALSLSWEVREVAIDAGGDGRTDASHRDGELAAPCRDHVRQLMAGGVVESHFNQSAIGLPGYEMTMAKAHIRHALGPTDVLDGDVIVYSTQNLVDKQFDELARELSSALGRDGSCWAGISEIASEIRKSPVGLTPSDVSALLTRPSVDKALTTLRERYGVDAGPTG